MFFYIFLLFSKWNSNDYYCIQYADCALQLTFFEIINHFLGGVSKLKSNITQKKHSKECVWALVWTKVNFINQAKWGIPRNTEWVSRTKLKGEQKRMTENKDWTLQRNIQMSRNGHHHTALKAPKFRVFKNISNYKVAPW